MGEPSPAPALPRQLKAALATDASSVLAMGLGEWQKTLYWPVSEDEFRALTACINASFEAAHDRLDPVGGDLLLSDLGFKSHLLQHAHAMAVVARCRERSVEVVVANARSAYRYDWAVLAKEYVRVRRAFTSADEIARRIWRRYRYNAHLTAPSRGRGTLAGSLLASLGSLHGPKTEFIGKQGKFCDFPHYEQFAGRSGGPSKGVRDARRAVIDEAVRDISQHMQRTFDTKIDGDSIARAWVDRLSTLQPTYDIVRQKARPGSHLLLGSPGNAFIRAYAMGAKKDAKTKVTMIFHAHQAGYTVSPEFCYTDFAICDAYIAPTRRAARSLKYVADAVALTRKLNVQFESLETAYYRNLWRRHEGRRSPTPVRKVMLQGFPLDDIRYGYGSGLFSILRLDLDVRLISALRTNGFEILYKPHPSTLELSRRALADLVDEFIPEPFEEAYHRADLLLFTYPLTSTYGYAVCSDKPIVLLDLAALEWNPAIYKHLERRCAMVPAWYDERNRIDFDEKALVDAVKSAADRMDYGYVFEYLIPKAA